jgi:hypothetical protein
MAISTHALLPIFLARLLTLPAVFTRAPLPAGDLPGLLPSSLAALLPASSSPLLLAVASSADLFTVWAVVLLVLGMAQVAGSSRLRSAAVVTVLWLAQIALFKLVPAASALAGSRGGA